MAKTKQCTFAAIDVGTSKICSIIANAGQGNALRILGTGVAPSKGLSRGVVTDIEETKEAVKQSVIEAERVSGLNVHSAYIGVSGKHIQSLNNRGVVAITRNDKLVSSNDLDRVLESARNITISDDRSLVHVIPKDYTLDGQVGIKEPVGMHGFRLDAETHIITAATTSIQNLTKSIRGAGVEVEDLILSSLASSEAVLTEEEKTEGVILADIGSETTDIAVFKNGTVWHSTVIPVGGYQLTRDISIGLGVPFDVAEQMKKKYGKAIPIQNGLVETSDHEEGNGHGIATKDLCEIIRARVEEILRMIVIELPQSDYISLVPAGIVLTGGTSNLPGIEKLGQDILRLPVRIGIPRDIYGLTDNLYNPAYATGIGLMLWGAKHEASEGLPPSNLKDSIGSTFRHNMFRIKNILHR
ncbi:MAG: cell division protein FtsA [Dehalococcoidia bacterium]|nr:cell division protein FtsA [Dehalococcoidia bacterium]